jgi:hypothetical protein
MDIVLLQAASGSVIKGPNVRVPPGNYNIEKKGKFDVCKMSLNDSDMINVNSLLILSNHTSVKLEALNAENLTVRFVRES